MSRVRQCYCAFCRSRRRVYWKRHVSALDVLYGFFLAFLLGWIAWQEWNFQFLPIAATIIGLTEVGIQIRWRLGVVCQRCGFDPVLYCRQPEKAAARVKSTIEKRFLDPLILDKSLPIMALLRKRPKMDSLVALK